MKTFELARKELAVLSAVEAIRFLAEPYDPDNLSDEQIELRAFAEASIYEFIAIVDEE